MRVEQLWLNKLPLATQLGIETNHNEESELK